MKEEQISVEDLLMARIEEEDVLLGFLNRS